LKTFCLSSSAKITIYTKKAKIQTTLASAQFMRNAYTYKPKHSTQVEYLKNKYKKNQMWQVLKETVKKFIKLLKHIEYKAQEYGIRVHYVNERYTSKAGCISDDIRGIPNGYRLTNVFNGKRVKKGLFLDAVINKIFNADINGAINYIKVATRKSFEWLKNKLFKLCNSVKIKSDYEFCRLLKGQQNSMWSKSVTRGATI